MTEYYVYVLIDPRTKEPFYVGKGKGNRWRHHTWNNVGRTNEKCRKLREDSVQVEPVFAFRSEDESAALAAEKVLISFFGRLDFDPHGCLINRNIGGNGGKGVSWDTGRKQAQRIRMQGDRNPMHGRTHTSAAKQLISSARVSRGGSPHSMEHREHLRQNNAGGKATSKPIGQFDVSGELVKIWPSASQAAKSVGARKGNLCSCATTKKHQKCKGFYWRYEPFSDKLST